MDEEIKFSLSSDSIENLKVFSEILKKDVNTILNEALENYFEEAQNMLMEKNTEDENAMTNLDFNEFWDDMDI